MRTFSVNFMVRPSKVNKQGVAPIEATIIVDNERTIVQLQRKVEPTKFDTKKQLVKGKGEDTKDTNEYLSLMKAKFYEAQTSLIKLDLAVTAQSVKDMFLGKIKGNQCTLFELYDEHNQDVLKQVKAGNLVMTSYDKHIVAYRYLKLYLQENFGRKDIGLSEINASFVQGFFTFLLGKMQNNSAIQNIKKFKKIINLALANNYIQVNPFLTVKYRTQKIEVDFLTESELEVLIHKDLGTDRLTKIRDVFVFNCFTGLAFTDAKTLTKDDFVTDNDGNKWIKKNRQKTNVMCKIPLLPVAEQLLERYDYKLPFPSNQKMNSYLKEIAAICGIKKELHTHIARHTAATLFLNNGLSIESTASILGHTNTKQTQHYAKLLDNTVMKQTAKIATKYKSI